MPATLSTTARRAALAAAVAPALAAAPAPPAHAAPLPTRLPIVLSATGFAAPGAASYPAGRTTFDVRNTDATGHWWSVAAARPGVTEEKVAADVTASYSPDPAVALPALRAYYQDLDFAGGAALVAGGALSYTITLGAGVYYLTDQLMTSATPVQAALLTVSGTNRPAPAPPAAGRIEVAGGAGGHRFRMPARLPARRSYVLANRSDQPQEFIFFRVGPEVTDASLQAYFDAARSGGTPPADPLADEAGGLLAISPGRQVVFTPGYGPGRYAVLSFLRNQWTGVKGAYQGLHRVFTVC